MKTLTTICMILMSNLIFSQNQEIDQLIKIKNELENRKNTLIDSINKVDKKINELKAKETLKNIEFDETRFTITKPKMKGNIKDMPDSKGNVINTFTENDNIKIYNYNSGYWLVEKDSKKGYIHNMYFENNEYMTAIKDAYEQKQDQDFNKGIFENAKIREKERELEIIKKYGEIDGRKILGKKIWLGMTEEMLYDSWGTPKSINRTVTTYGVHKQCVYGSDTYVYIEDGKVTSWQD